MHEGFSTPGHIQERNKESFFEEKERKKGRKKERKKNKGRNEGKQTVIVSQNLSSFFLKL